ncbi:uncharacterized protein KRP23_4401 [Phytophthora ramorum]|uniref:uncharacterized protein n=1 Tax=Phytophthora ramorum TaxID=164328 RepID=UPI0030A115F6|nr:hypothetical protein KRP23_4401 [Phytophthora ramorum]
MRTRSSTRTASSERTAPVAAEAAKRQATLTLETDDDGTMMLDSAEIGSSSGQTPLAAMTVTSLADDGHDGYGGGAAGGNGDAPRGQDTTGGGGSGPRDGWTPDSGRGADAAGRGTEAPGAGNAGGLGSAGRGRFPPVQAPNVEERR